ncbi:MAG: ABC transporter ATP-binding protein [Candidatus Hydrogenedentota bacterium]|nr:MAG: ABC transporter ATP-binding protein [Candidatus Hydrogenedentota bacterium]
MIPEAVEFREVTKVYAQGTRAVDNVTFSIHRGEIFSLLGPNGAGKTTLIQILSGIVEKTAGKVFVEGVDLDRDPYDIRRRLGYVPQEIAFDPFFTPREILRLTRGYFGLPPDQAYCEELLRTFALAEKGDEKARQLSGGMRRRLLIARALVHRPTVLLLDEPTAGVDVELRRSLWETVRRLKESGTTILLTTHYLEEAEELSDRTCILSEGHILALDETDLLVEKMGRDRVIELFLEDLPHSIPEILVPYRPRVANGRLYLSYAPGEAGRVLKIIAGSDLRVRDLRVHTDDLEDIFLRLTREAA